MVPGSLGCGSAVFAAMATFAPSCAARKAIALPIPRLAPVMKRVFPANVAISIPHNVGRQTVTGGTPEINATTIGSDLIRRSKVDLRDTVG